MSKSKRSGKKHSSKPIADITINDFANSTICKNRLKKSSNNVTKVLKNLEEEKSWDDKDDEFEGDFVEQVNEDGSVSYVIQKVEGRRRKKTSSFSDQKSDDNGKEYPIDIWYLISEYIRPEDVGRFAGICRASFEVVSGAKFWFSLYKRYYTSVPNLPERLQLESLLRKYNLRASVIRALHYMYPPFVERIKGLTALEQHPDVLKKKQCILMWHEMENKGWVYYFKMKENNNNLPPYYRKNEVSVQPDLLEILDDVSANPDDRCRVLRVTCVHFIPVPPVLGMTLTSVSLNLSQGFRHHRLQLGFGNGIQVRNSPIDGSSCTVIILDPVINVKVLNWWHPLYPHTYNMEHLLNQE